MKNIYILAVMILILFIMSGCGANPTGNNTPATITMSVNFPTQPAGLNALISGSTASMNVSVRDSLGGILGTGTLTPLASTTTIALQPYNGIVGVNVQSFGPTGQQTGNVIQHATVSSGLNAQISLVSIEYRQGVSGAAAPLGTFAAPDGTSYNINSIFLDSDTLTGNYQMGMNVSTIVGGVGYHYSSSNINASKSSIPAIVDGVVTIPIDVPNANRTIWNQYDITISFINGGVASNTPNITGAYKGSFTYDALGNVIPATGQPNAIALNLLGAAWTNNIAPASGAVTILF